MSNFPFHLSTSPPLDDELTGLPGRRLATAGWLTARKLRGWGSGNVASTFSLLHLEVCDRVEGILPGYVVHRQVLPTSFVLKHATMRQC